MSDPERLDQPRRTTRRRTSGRLVVGLAALLAALPLATAASGPAMGAGATQGGRLRAVRDTMEKAQALFLAGKLEEAARTFDKGYEEFDYSAFLFNAAVVYQKLGDLDRAVARLRSYLKENPSARDRPSIEKRIERLEAARRQQPAPGAGGAAGAGGAGGAIPTGPAIPKPPSVDAQEGDEDLKSLVVIETNPPGAPVVLYQRVSPRAKAFDDEAKEHPGWKRLGRLRSPTSLSMSVGSYHLVVERFRDFNRSGADLEVTPGRVLHFKANLSQGAFMAFLRVTSNVPGAKVYLGTPGKKRRRPWGPTPHGELVPSGKWTVTVEALGRVPFKKVVTLEQGQQKVLEARLDRVRYGYLLIDGNAPKMTVSIDDGPLGEWRRGSGPMKLKVASGKRHVVIRSEGRKTYDGYIEVPRGKVLPVHAKMVPLYPRGAAWVQAFIGAAVLGGSIYAGVESERLAGELEDDRNAGVLDADDERIPLGRWLAVGADAGFAVAGIFGILSIYNFVRDPLPPSSRALGKPAEFDVLKKLKGRVANARPLRAPARKTAGDGAFIGPLKVRGGGGLTIGGRF